MAQDVISIRLEESGYYGGYWFDTGGKHVVEDTPRLRTAIQNSDTAELVNTFVAEHPDGVFDNLQADASTLGATSADSVSLAERLSLTPLDAAPDNPSFGDYALADGTNWDPAATGNATTVIYDGSGWVSDIDLGTAAP